MPHGMRTARVLRVEREGMGTVVTYEQLRTEPEWNAQYVPPYLAALGDMLERFFDPGRTNIGIYGDNRHRKGSHRSRRWIRESRYCTNRSYTVTETPGNRNGGNENWICGIDIVVGETRSKAIFHRLNEARQRGILTGIFQVLLERDPWHVHIGLDRAHANNNPQLLYAVITGTLDEGRGLVQFPVEMPELRQGSNGRDVITAQHLLSARGFETDVDGEFGPDTEAKTRAMQQQYGAESVDGLWGKETWTIAITGEDRL